MDETRETRRITWICFGIFTGFAALLLLSELKLEWLQFLLVLGAFVSLIFTGIGVTTLLEHRFRYWRW